MNIPAIIIYLEKLNSDNIELELKLSKIENENNELKNNLSNLTKVSFIGNMDKQLNEKIRQNELLEKQLYSTNRQLNEKIRQNELLEKQLNNKEDLIISDKEDIIISNKEDILDNEIDKSTKINYIISEKISLSDSPEIITPSPENILLAEPIIDEKLIKKEHKKKKNYELIQYKKIKYYLDTKTNIVYDIISDKINKHVANFVNNKLVFI